MKKTTFNPFSLNVRAEKLEWSVCTLLTCVMTKVVVMSAIAGGVEEQGLFLAMWNQFIPNCSQRDDGDTGWDFRKLIECRLLYFTYLEQVSPGIAEICCSSFPDNIFETYWQDDLKKKKPHKNTFSWSCHMRRGDQSALWINSKLYLSLFESSFLTELTSKEFGSAGTVFIQNGRKKDCALSIEWLKAQVKI